MNEHRSPAFALSTKFPLNIISILRGTDPGGASSISSYTLTFYQSINIDSLITKSHYYLFEHVGFEHLVGVVYENYYLIPSSLFPQIPQINVPSISSGLTSDALTTCPLIVTRHSTPSGIKSRILIE